MQGSGHRQVRRSWSCVLVMVLSFTQRQTPFPPEMFERNSRFSDLHHRPGQRYDAANKEEAMPDQITLSEKAVASLRFRIKGLPLREQDRPAYCELVAAGIMEPTSGSDYRFTA